MASNEPTNADVLVQSSDPLHPANHICDLCAQFYRLGWVTGTGGGVSIKHGSHVYIAPSGVQKELMKPTDMFVMDYESQQYIRRPTVGTHRLRDPTYATRRNIVVIKKSKAQSPRLTQPKTTVT